MTDKLVLLTFARSNFWGSVVDLLVVSRLQRERESRELNKVNNDIKMWHARTHTHTQRRQNQQKPVRAWIRSAFCQRRFCQKAENVLVGEKFFKSLNQLRFFFSKTQSKQSGLPFSLSFFPLFPNSLWSQPIFRGWAFRNSPSPNRPSFSNVNSLWPRCFLC